MAAISVIGAGPVGLKVGTILKKDGFDVEVFEEHREVGEPVNCGGLISRSGVEELGLNLDECLLNQVKGAHVYAPDGTKLTLKRRKTVAYVIDRKKFDQRFHNQAIKYGLDVRLNSRLINVRGNSLFLERDGHGEMKKSKIVIGADGVNSAVRNVMHGRTEMDNFIHTMQATAEGSFDKDFAGVYFGKYIKGFFGWVIPESSTIAKIGIGTKLGENVSESFDKFLIDAGLDVEILERSSSLIPSGLPMREPVKENMLIVGDAAFHTKATTGGGIITGLKAADICAESVMQHMKHGKSLFDYGKNLGEVNKELKMHWKIHNYLSGLSNEKMNKLFAKLQGAGIEEFLAEHGDMDVPSKFIGKMARSPKFWFMGRILMGILRS